MEFQVNSFLRLLLKSLPEKYRLPFAGCQAWIWYYRFVILSLWFRMGSPGLLLPGPPESNTPGIVLLEIVLSRMEQTRTVSVVSKPGHFYAISCWLRGIPKPSP